jgi:predicted regulator of Ras-like GTPase activity (Roadblock/LC7/MglB family)
MQNEIDDLTIKEKLEKITNDLQNIGGIEASTIARRDGLLIYSNISSEQNARTFAAMSATILGASEIITSVHGKGIPDNIIVGSKHGKIIMTGAGKKALLIVMTKSDSFLRLILIEIAKASERIKEVLG